MYRLELCCRERNSYYLIAFIKHYSLLSSRLTALLSNSLRCCQMQFGKSDQPFIVCFEYLPKWLQCHLVFTLLVPRETAAISAHVLCTPYNHAPVYSVTLFEPTQVGCVAACFVTKEKKVSNLIHYLHVLLPWQVLSPCGDKLCQKVYLLHDLSFLCQHHYNLFSSSHDVYVCVCVCVCVCVYLRTYLMHRCVYGEGEGEGAGACV